MSPQELGAFCMVSIRPYGSKPSDDDDTIRLPDGRVMEHHVVIFDYNAGGGERAINSQASATTEACLAVVMIEEDKQGLDIQGACGGRWGINSDNCCSDLKCADHLGALDTWVNPSPARSPQAVLQMKKSLAITDLPRFWGAAKHGKWLIDAVIRLRCVSFAPSGCLTARTAAVALQLATFHRQEADSLSLNWTPGDDVPVGKIEGAAQLVEHMKKERMGKGKLKRQRRAELTGNESADAELKVNSVNYYHLTVEFQERRNDSFCVCCLLIL